MRGSKHERTESMDAPKFLSMQLIYGVQYAWRLINLSDDLKYMLYV